MKRLLTILLGLGSLITCFGLNFLGHQSLVNLGAVKLFTAPASGIYFIQGNLSLPQQTQTGVSGSQVVAQVSKNGLTTLYYGIPGASGFALPAVTLVSNDSISMS